MEVSEAKRLKTLENENTKPNRLLVDAMLDNAALKDLFGKEVVTPIADHWVIIVNLLAGSLAGAWIGAGWETRMKSATLYRVIPLFC